jgi:hypothetical protein
MRVSMSAVDQGPVFVSDDQMGYDRSRTVFAPDASMRLDEAYRLAHLPLVNPAHRDVVPREPGKSYEMGLHPRIHSLVLPVPATDLAASPVFQRLQREIVKAPFAPKIAWEIMDRRADRLHATIAGSLGDGEAVPVISAEALAAITALGPFRVKIQGLFSGNVNRGRLYLKLYPEWRNGTNAIQAIQKLLGRQPTDLYLVGLYNLTDHLDGNETAALSDLIDHWWSRPLLEIDVTELWLLSACDDLVLDSRIETRISLFSP